MYPCYPKAQVTHLKQPASWFYTWNSWALGKTSFLFGKVPTWNIAGHGRMGRRSIAIQMVQLRRAGFSRNLFSRWCSCEPSSTSIPVRNHGWQTFVRFCNNPLGKSHKVRVTSRPWKCVLPKMEGRAAKAFGLRVSLGHHNNNLNSQPGCSFDCLHLPGKPTSFFGGKPTWAHLILQVGFLACWPSKDVWCWKALVEGHCVGNEGKPPLWCGGPQRSGEPSGLQMNF